MVLFWKKPSTDQGSVSDNPNDFLKRMMKSGDELMTIVGPEDGSCACGDWVGAVVSVNGDSEEWPPLLEALEDGVFHEGCQHRLESYSSKNRIEAEFCTGLAIAAMRERRKFRDKASGTAAAQAQSDQRQWEFSKLYNAAQSADENGALETALSKCEAALEILHGENVFGEDQERIEQILEARIRGIFRQRTQS